MSPRSDLLDGIIQPVIITGGDALICPHAHLIYFDIDQQLFGGEVAGQERTGRNEFNALS
jgi:hypothetical protein